MEFLKETVLKQMRELDQSFHQTKPLQNPHHLKTGPFFLTFFRKEDKNVRKIEFLD
jgi:hypothetical protein